MHYKAPIRMRPSLTVNRGGAALRPSDSLPGKSAAPAQVSPFDLADVLKMVEELKTMHAKVTEALGRTATAEELAKMHAETNKKVDDLASTWQTVKQGPKGDVGKAAEPAKEVDLGEVARRAAALVPRPKDGITPVVDEKKIAKRAAKLITVPKVEPGKDADPDAILERVFEKLKKGEVKVHVTNVEGLEDKFTEVRSKMTSEVEQYGKNTMKRGGGDTVAAGTNVTITTNGQGQKVINATGGGSSIKVADLSSQCNGSNKVFTIPALTTIIGLTGTDAPIVYRPTTDFTAAGTTLTLGTGVTAPSQGATLLLTYV